MKRLSAVLGSCLLLSFSVVSQAQSVINFDSLVLPDYGTIPGNYGDHQAGTTHIGVSYHTIGHATFPNNIRFWNSDYGDLSRVGFAYDNGFVGEVVLTPDPGYEVILDSFDMAGWFRADLNADVLRLVDGNGNAYAGFDYAANAGGNYLVLGASTHNPAHSHFAPGLASSGPIRIQWGHNWNIGIDNINFNERLIPQVNVPEPGALGMLGGTAFSGLLLALRRRRAQ